MGNCARSKECAASSLWLTHEQPRLFHSPQWFCCDGSSTTKGWSDVLYLTYRLFWALYLSTWLIFCAVSRSVSYEPPVLGVQWLIYLTDWALITLTANADVRAVATAHAYFAYTRHGLKIKRMTWWLKMCWFLYEVSNAIALLVTLLFWTVILKDVPADTVDVHGHAVNSAYVLLDCFVTATPVQILHFWIPLLFGVVYALFSLAYDLLGGNNTFGNPFIYDVIDWSADPTKAVIYLIATMAVVAVAHIALFGLSKLRILISNQCKTTSTSVDPISAPTEHEIYKDRTDRSSVAEARVTDIELANTLFDV